MSLFRAVSARWSALKAGFFKHPAARVGCTALWALAAAQLCLHLNTPLPWMIGPLVATAAVSMLGARTLSWAPLRNVSQWTIGAALGLYFTPQVVSLLGSLWWAFVLGIVWALALGWGFGVWLHRVHSGPGFFHLPGLSRITTYFASPIGAASEMTLLGERHGAQSELVASAHSLRVLLVTLIVPFGFQWAGFHGLDATGLAVRLVQWPGLAALAALTGLGCWLMLKLDRPNPWFIGALMVSLGLTGWGVNLSALPAWLTNGAQLLIGVSLGVRFTPGFVRLAPLWMGSVAASSVAMILLSAGFAWTLAQFTPLHWATVLLATAPGGIAEMAITAKVLQLSVPVITAFHVTRLAAVLLLAEPLYRWVYVGRQAAQR